MTLTLDVSSVEHTDQAHMEPYERPIFAGA